MLGRFRPNFWNPDGPVKSLGWAGLNWPSISYWCSIFDFRVEKIDPIRPAAISSRKSALSMAPITENCLPLLLQSATVDRQCFPPFRPRPPPWTTTRCAKRPDRRRGKAATLVRFTRVGFPPAFSNYRDVPSSLFGNLVICIWVSR